MNAIASRKPSNDYLCTKYEHMSVARYLREHYENAEQRFTLARAA